MDKWYVIRTTYSLTPGGLIRYAKNHYAGPFDNRIKAKEIIDGVAVTRPEDGYPDKFYVGTEDDIGTYGLIVK